MNWTGHKTYSLEHVMPKDSEAASILGALKEKSSYSRFLNAY